MIKRNLSVFAAVLMALGPATFTSLAHAGEDHPGPRRIREEARFVGSSVIAVSLEYQDGQPADSAVLNRSQARGRWGRSETQSLTRLDFDNPAYSDCWGGDFGLLFSFTQFDFQTTYADLSSIHGTISGGELCANVTDQPDQRTYWLEGKVLGGTGRLAGATGVVRIEGRLTQFEPGRFSVSEGTSVTTLTLP